MKILAIDDEYRLLQGLVATIRQVLPDAEVLSYSEVVRANEEIDPKEIDIAFLDIEMRGMNGTAYAEILRKANPRINIIFTTGYSEYSGKAMELHASGYIMKPVTPEKLEKELRDLRYPLPASAFSGGADGNAGGFESNNAIDRHAAYGAGGTAAGGAVGSGAGSIGSAGNSAGGPGSDGSTGSASTGLTGKAAGPGKRNVLTVRTFGNFEVYVNNVPLNFRYSSKTRELLAYLIDRQGALCSNGELIGILWDDADDPDRKISYLKNLRLDLLNTLGRSGLDDLIIRQRGRIAIAADSARLDCDYYDWIRKRENAAPFLGEYMEQYSWAEVTKANLERAYVASLG